MPAFDYEPTIADVGTILRTRTVDTSGTEIGDFTDDTRPTGSQVGSLITLALRDVDIRVGDEIPDTLWQEAMNAVIYRTGMLIELSYFPEQIGTNRSPYEQYKQLYDEYITILMEAVAAAQAAGGLEDTTQSPGLARFGFPTDAGGMIGWQTRW